MQQKKLLKLLSIAFLAGYFGITEVNAQPPGGGGPGGTEPPCWPPPCIPIDGGISLLIAAGAAFGAKKVYDMKARQ